MGAGIMVTSSDHAPPVPNPTAAGGASLVVLPFFLFLLLLPRRSFLFLFLFLFFHVSLACMRCFFCSWYS